MAQLYRLVSLRSELAEQSEWQFRPFREMAKCSNKQASDVLMSIVTRSHFSMKKATEEALSDLDYMRPTQPLSDISQAASHLRCRPSTTIVCADEVRM
jgi:hypothetical protein